MSKKVFMSMEDVEQLAEAMASNVSDSTVPTEVVEETPVETTTTEVPVSDAAPTEEVPVSTTVTEPTPATDTPETAAIADGEIEEEPTQSVSSVSPDTQAIESYFGSFDKFIT